MLTYNDTRMVRLNVDISSRSVTISTDKLLISFQIRLDLVTLPLLQGAGEKVGAVVAEELGVQARP